MTEAAGGRDLEEREEEEEEAEAAAAAAPLAAAASASALAAAFALFFSASLIFLSSSRSSSLSAARRLRSTISACLRFSASARRFSPRLWHALMKSGASPGATFTSARASDTAVRPRGSGAIAEEEDEDDDDLEEEEEEDFLNATSRVTIMGAAAEGACSRRRRIRLHAKTQRGRKNRAAKMRSKSRAREAFAHSAPALSRGRQRTFRRS